MLLAQDLPINPEGLAEAVGTLDAISQLAYIIVLLIIAQLIFMVALVIWVRSTGKTSTQENDLHGKHLDALQENNKTLVNIVAEFSKASGTFAATIHYWGRDRAAIQSISKSQAELARSYHGLRADVNQIKQHMDKRSTDLE